MAKMFKLSLGKKPEPDDDLDFPDFDFDNPEIKDDRNPTTKVILSTKKAFVENLKDKEKLKEKLKENLPSEYGEAHSLYETGVREAKTFVDDSVKQLKPIALNLSKSAKMFLPSNFSRLHAKLDKIEEWARQSSLEKQSKEAQREQELSITLGRIFAQNQEQEAARAEVEKAEEQAKDKVKEAIDLGKHRAQMHALDLINKATTQTAHYTTRINAEWQKKTLELQYRLLFANRDILETLVKKSENDKTLLQVIAKNTALPDYRKLQLNESFLENSRNKFVGSVFNKAGGYTSRLWKNFREKIKTGLDSAQSMSDMVLTGVDMMKMMEDLEGKKSLGERAGGLAGNTLANKLRDVAIGKLGQKLRENPDFVKKVSYGANRLRYWMNNKDRMVKDLENIEDDDPNLIKRGIGKFVRTFGEDKSVKTSVDRASYSGLTGAGVITNQFTKSVTEIIPGYLARILKEITVLRTGNEKTSLLRFDYKRDRFIGEKTLTGLYKREFRNTYKTIEPKIQPILTEFEKNTKLSEEEKNKTKEFLIRYALDGRLFSIDNFSNESTYNRYLDSSLSEKLANSFKQTYQDYDKGERARREVLLSRQLNDVSSSFSTSAAQAQSLVSLGQEDITKKAGMLTKYGSYDLEAQIKDNARRIKSGKGFDHRTKEQIDEQDNLDAQPSDYKAREKYGDWASAASDILAKENIKSLGTDKILDKLSKLKVKFWEYKKGHKAEDGKEHIGPMAQDVHKLFGSKAAPGSTKIDLVNMNGILTQSVKELNDKVDGISKNSKVSGTDRWSLIEQIKINTDKIAQANLFSIGIIGGLDLSKINLKDIKFGDMAAMAKNQIKNKAKWAYDYLDDGSLKSHLHGLANAGLGIAQSGFEAGNTLIKSIKGLGSLSFDKLKKGAEWAWKNPIKQTREYLQEKKARMLDNVDVFVEGEDTPRMLAIKLRRGDYIEAGKDKVIKTRADILNIETEIRDKITGDTVLVRKELNNVYFRNVTTNAILKAAKWVKDKGVGIYDGVKSFVPKAYTMAFDGLKKIYKTALKLIDKPQDIYVKGESMPRIFKFKMEAGQYINARTSKVIERPGQITGMVYDVNGNMVLSNEDFEKGLVDAHGRPITNIIGNTINAVRKASQLAKTLTVTTLKKTLQFGKNVAQGAVTLATHGLSGFSFNAPFGLNKEATNYLKQIRDILNARLPGEGGFDPEDTDDKSSSNKTAKVDSFKTPKLLGKVNHSIHGAGSLIGSALSGAFGLGKRLFNKGKQTLDDAQDSEVIQKGKAYKKEILNKLEKNKDTTQGKIKELEQKLKRLTGKAKDRFTEAKQGITDRIGSWKNRQRENVNEAKEDTDRPETRIYDTKNTYDLIAEAASKVKNKVLDYLGLGEEDNRSRKRGRAKKKINPKAGKKGLAYRSGKVLGAGKNLLTSGIKSVAGMGAAGYKAVGGLAGVTAGLGRVVPVATAGYGGYQAVASINQGNYGDALLNGAMTLGGLGLMGVSLPVLAGIGAVGVVGTGIWHLYKRNKNKALSDLQTLRMLEYGFRGGDKTSHLKLRALEEMVLPFTKVSADHVEIQNERLDSSKIYALFGIQVNNQSKESMERKQWFDLWWSKRFYPVYAKWLKALYLVNHNKELKTLDQENTQRDLKILENIRGDQTGWDIGASPLGESTLNTDSSVITNFYKALYDKYQKKNKDNKAGEKTVSKTDKVKPSEKVQKAFTGNETSLNKIESTVNAVTGSSQTKQISKITLSDRSFASFEAIAHPTHKKQSLPAVDIIKYKAYGLVQLETLKINQLYKLEKWCSEFISFDNHSQAFFNGSNKRMLFETAKFFGVDLSDKMQAYDYSTWLKERFMVVYLDWCTAARNITGNDQFLKTGSIGDKTDALAVQLANHYMGLTNIWLINKGPWRAYLLSDIKSAKLEENAEHLSQLVKTKTYQDLVKPVTTTAAIKTSYTPKENVEKFKAIEKNLQSMVKPVQIDQEIELNEKPAVAGNKSSVSATPKVQKGSTGQLKLASGDLVTGSGASQYLMMQGTGVDLSQMNPDFMRLFNGMVEEYGQKTGKSITVTSAWRSMAKQAELYNKLPPGRAARPGQSLHEFGLAMDISTRDLDELDKLGLLRKYGFTRPIAKESWHIEPVGFLSPEIIQKAKRDPSFAKQAMMSGVGRGGGGIGSTMRNANRYFRDWKTHEAIFNASVTPEALKEVDQITKSLGLNDSKTKAEPSLGLASNLDSSKNPLKGSTSFDEAESKAEYGKDVKGSQNAYNSITEVNSQKGWKAQKATIEAAAKATGVDSNLMASIAAIESGFDPNAKAKTSSAKGLYQFIDGTWNQMMKKYGKAYGIPEGTSPTDPRANAILGALYLKENQKALSKVKSDINGTDLYMAHFLGARGAHQFFRLNDQTLAADHMQKAARANKSIFFKKDGTARTKAEVYQLMQSKVQNALKRHGVADASVSYKPSSIPEVKALPTAPAAKVVNPTHTASVETYRPTLPVFEKPLAKPSQLIHSPHSDPSMVYKGINQTNQLLGEQLNVLKGSQELLASILKATLNLNQGLDKRSKDDSSTLEAVAKPAAKALKASSPVIEVGEALIKRSRSSIV